MSLDRVREADIEQTFAGLLRYLDMEQDEPNEYGWSPEVKQGYLMAMADALDHARPILTTHEKEDEEWREMYDEKLRDMNRWQVHDIDLQYAYNRLFKERNELSTQLNELLEAAKDAEPQLRAGSHERVRLRLAIQSADER